jgi:hypothetical protein
MTTTIRRLPGALSAATLAAILVGALASSACEQDRSTLKVRAQASLTDPQGLAGLRLRIGSAVYQALDFVSGDVGVPTISLDVPGRGHLEVEVELTQAGEVVAQGSVTLAMREDFEWGMSVFRQAEDPQEQCFGCSGGEGFPVTEAAGSEPGETLWLVWGGKPYGSDIVY